MIEMIAIKQSPKQDAAERTRSPDTPKSEKSDRSTPFDQEYQSQNSRAAQAEPLQEKPAAQEQQTAKDQTSNGKDGEAPEAEKTLTSASDENEALPEVALADAQPEAKTAKTRALSENAFGEQIARTQQAKAGAVPDDVKQRNQTLSIEDQKKAEQMAQQDDTTIASKKPAPVTAAMVAKANMPAGTAEKAVASVTAKSVSPVFSGSVPPETQPMAAELPRTPVEQQMPPRATSLGEVTAKPAKDANDTNPSEKRMRLSMERAQPADSDVTVRIAPKQTIAPQTTQAVSATPAQMVVAEKIDASTAITEADASIPVETRSSTSPTSLQQIINRPETPIMVSRQLAEAMQRFPDRPIEVALNPEELGRVRMSISAIETGITVTVLAERPETLDMMRRHIDQLAREFQAIGYENINFAFSEGQTEQGGDDAQSNSHARGSDAADAQDDTADNPVGLKVTTGVDVRL
jgi:hypothetical protein